MPKVKICGITGSEDALLCCESGADHIGLIFVEGTPRFVNADRAVSIISSIPDDIIKKTVVTGVFRDTEQKEIIDIADICGLGMIQLQGEEPPEYCLEIKRALSLPLVKAFRVDNAGKCKGKYAPLDYSMCDHFLFDTYHPELSGGTGETFRWEDLDAISISGGKTFFVAGGLNPVNVTYAVDVLCPYGVDVSSGVEMYPGKKDPVLVREFIKNAKKEKFTG